MIGQRFGRLVVVSEAPKGTWGKMWVCRCDCGEGKVVAQGNLRSGTTKSCGSAIHKRPDIIGEKYNLLTIKSHAETANGKRRVIVACDCGEEKVVDYWLVRGGKTKSCGCLRHNPTHNKTHGLSKTKTYWVWLNMMHRCYQAHHKQYHRYGGRGIFVDEAWHVFEQFLSDMGEKPDGLEIDRIDNNKGYSKENCRWVTRVQNCLNKNNNRWLVLNGETLSLSEIVTLSGKAHSTIHQRLALGLSVDDAMTLPSHQGRTFDDYQAQ